MSSLLRFETLDQSQALCIILLLFEDFLLIILIQLEVERLSQLLRCVNKLTTLRTNSWVNAALRNKILILGVDLQGLVLFGLSRVVEFFIAVDVEIILFLLNGALQ